MRGQPRIITEETRQEICRDYQDKTITLDQMYEKYRLPKARIAKIAVEMGAAPRREKAWGSRNGSCKKCPKCRNTIDVKGAKFCCYCGSDLRSEKELLIERIENAFKVIQLLPQTQRDEMQQLFLEVIKALKERDNV